MNGNTLAQVNGGGAFATSTPNVTVGAYLAGQVVGGVQALTNVLPATFNGILESLELSFNNTLQTGSWAVAIFTAKPAGTFNDNAAPGIAIADSALLLGIYALSSAQSPLGTHTIYTLDGIGKQIIGVSPNLYAVVIAVSAPTAPTSTSEMSLSVGVVW